MSAIQKIDDSFGVDQLTRIQTAEVSDSEAVYTDVMVHLLNQIAALPITFILALDDCHYLKDRVLVGLIRFMIDRLPQQMRLIMLTREDLPIPIARMRARRELVEIRQADLQFLPEETKDYLQKTMGIDQLNAQEIMALEQKTEGWIAGLQLAGLSIKSDPDPARFIQSFTGTDRYILDYLMEEVFKHQPQDIQAFLLATSIVDRFCAPLCETLLSVIQVPGDEKVSSCEDVLDQIEHANLFLIPLDYTHTWFRYHHLFSDLLRHSLGRIAPGKITSLHQRASQWLEVNNEIPAAVRHAFQTHDWTYAAELVESHAWNMILHSRVADVSEWCGNFPEEVIRSRPALCIYHAWALTIAFKKENFPAAYARIRQAEAALPAIDPNAGQSLIAGSQPVNKFAWASGQVTLLHSFMLMASPRRAADPAALAELGQLAFEQLPPEDITGRSVGLLDIAYSRQACCDAADAEKRFAQVVDVALSGGNYFGAVVADYHRAHGLLVQGRLQETIAFCDQKRKTYEALFSNPIQELPAIALLDQAKGCALLESSEAAAAGQLLLDGLEVGQWMPREELPGYLALARFHASTGDRPGLEACLRRLDMRWPDIGYCTQAMRIYYDLIDHPDDVRLQKRAAVWVQAARPDIGPDTVLPGIGPAWNDEADYAVYTAWSQVQILLGKASEALSIIEPLAAAAEAHSLCHRVIELSMLKAQVFFAMGQLKLAWASLRQALSLSQAFGYRYLANRGFVQTALLREALKQGIAPDPDYLRQVLVGMDIWPGTAEQPPVMQEQPVVVLSEPLSKREREVLTAMAQGFSNADIATRLYLSPNTLKTHSQNIFSKLDVHNRVQAINKARILKLI
ncbi:MAG: LuxR C-terminal-related transcriptional regulator [Bacillota bacterium]|nr:LuxR C-terminal-related transcriptional regulator [Bacillota bacterium]